MRLLFAIILLSISVCVARQSAAGQESPTPPSDKPGQKNFADFVTLKKDLMGILSSAKERIWLVSDFVTDGDTVAALYVAQYRKVNVQVLLGRRKANSYMSRLGFFKRQNVPVFLKPDRFSFKSPTSILVDKKLYFVDAEMDFLVPNRHPIMREGSDEEAVKFEQDFISAFKEALPATPKPVREVGRIAPPENRVRARPSKAIYSPEEATGSYSHEHVTPGARPPGVPTKLPKETIWQQKTKDQKNSPETSSGETQKSSMIDNETQD